MSFLKKNILVDSIALANDHSEVFTNHPHTCGWQSQWQLLELSFSIGIKLKLSTGRAK